MLSVANFRPILYRLPGSLGVIAPCSSIRKALCFSTSRLLSDTETSELWENVCTEADDPSASSSEQETKHWESSTEHRSVDKDLEQAVIEAQDQPMEGTQVAAPYQSDFPLTSPILLEEQKHQSLLKRNQFLRQLISKAKGTTSESKDDKEAADKPSEDGPAPDPDTGYAELGGYSKEIVTGIFVEAPLKLHPSRSFFTSQQYDPEELHPYGVYRESGPTRRSRRIQQTYEQDVIQQKMDFKNLHFLNNYLSDSGLILPRRQTRLSIKMQVKLEKSVKLAQALALLPVLDRRSEFKRRPRRQTEQDIMS